MNPSIRKWLPATLVAGVILAVIAVLLIGRTPAAAPNVTRSPTPAALDSKAAVMAAVENYYKVEDQARATGNATLIDSVTTGPNSPASLNFKMFIAQQAAKNRRSIVVHDYFEAWAVTLVGATASTTYTFWLFGHDVDATTGLAVEGDMLLPKVRYRIDLQDVGGRWLVEQREVLRPA